MTGVQVIAGLLFEAVEDVTKQIGLDFHLRPAQAADQVMMVAAGQIVGQMAIAAMGSEDDAVGTQKFQGAIDSGLRHARRTDAGIDFCRREMPVVVQGFQDRQPLRRHAVAACAQGLGALGGAGHGKCGLIAKIINSNYTQQNQAVNLQLLSAAVHVRGGQLPAFATLLSPIDVAIMYGMASSNVLHCTQCGGELHPDEGQIFLTCPYCNSTVYLDKSQVVFHWYVAPTLDEAQARASLARWMAGNQTVKDLDKKAQLAGQTFEYFPMWYLKQRRPSGLETIVLEPAVAIATSELKALKLPGGDLRKYEAELQGQARPPSVPLEAARRWAKERHASQGEIIEQALVHIPLFTFKYSYQGRLYTAVVEAATGSVFANIYPAKAEAPYLLAGWLTAFTFLCLALAPIVGVIAADETGLAIGLAVCVAGSVLAVPALLAVAMWVAAKV